jgi:hypothetical protein
MTSPRDDGPGTDDLRDAVVEALAHIEAMRQRFAHLLADIEGTIGVQVPNQGRWTKDDVAALWTGVRHLQGAAALFEVTARHPNEAIAFDDVLAASGLTDQQQRSHHARISRISTGLFGGPRWPIQNWQGQPRHDGKAPMLYRMGGTVAEWWHEINEPASSRGRHR